MKHITMTCPNCNVRDKAVGDPDEHAMGHTGNWYCFSCHAHGTYSLGMNVVVKGA